jgi:hypothetical protein
MNFVIPLSILFLIGVYITSINRYENFTPPIPPSPANLIVKNEYVLPNAFRTGLDSEPMDKSSNMCGPSALYSSGFMEVDYGSTFPADCACLEFIQAP